MGKNIHPVECACHKAEREQQEAAINERKHLDLVRRLKADGFSDSAMLDWTFANDNGRSPQMHHAHRYVEQWRTMRSENIGLLLWGGVGTGKSFLAGCIANALMVQEVPVRLCDAFSVPVVTVVDTEGFVPSVSDDIAGGIREAARLLRHRKRRGFCLRGSFPAGQARLRGQSLLWQRIRRHFLI